MPDAVSSPPDLSRSVSSLARSLVAAARTWTLYPPDHPAVRAGVQRFARTLEDTCGGQPLALGVTPETLLLGGLPAPKADGPIAEAAAWLHQRDVLRLTFQGPVPLDMVEALLALLAEDPATLRERGGPAQAWAAQGHAAIGIDQIDLLTVLQDPGDEAPARRKDDLWRAIVRAALERRAPADAATQARMLAIAADTLAIGDLAQDVMAPNCTPDGSPLLTTQAAAVVAAYRHLISVVDVMAPERRADVLRNIATATAGLDPRVVLQIVGAAEDAAGGQTTGSLDLRRALADAMDDGQVAQLLATTLALDGQATDRIAAVFGTIAPDDERRRRVLTMTRGALSESALGRRTDFQTLWTSMEELLLSYNERPFVSESYRAGLDQAGARADGMAGDVPPELAALLGTLDQSNVRRLSVTLLLDLLGMERDAVRATGLARDLATLGEDLLLAGDYAGAHDVACALAAHAKTPGGAARDGARLALDAFIGTAAFHEAVDYLGEMDEASADLFARICGAAGAGATDALLRLLDVEAETAARVRAAAIVRGFGAAAVSRLAPLASRSQWFAQRNAAELLGAIGRPEAVPLLQPLLRSRDARVMQAAVRALSGIDDPSAARSVHTALRAAAGETRQAVVAALVAERDPRVVPLLARILDESDALGADHDVVLQTLGAVGVLGGDEALPAVDRVMRKTKWFARPKLRALKTASVESLRRIGTPAAAALLVQAAATGDRLLRRTAAPAGSAS